MDQGNPDGYFQFIASYGLNLGVNEADSLQFASSYLHYVSGNYDKAIPGFVRYVSLYTTGVRITDAYYYLGQCYLKKNDTLQAIAAFQKNHASGKSDFYEMATLELARLYYFQRKMYDSALIYFQLLYDNASDNENKLEGLRGLVRCYYRLGKYENASDKVDQLLHSNGVSADDKVVAWMVLAKSKQAEGKCDSAIQTYKNIIGVSQSYWGAEARYESARCLFKNDKWKAAEKMAMSVINETGSYDYWVTRAYLLLGDIFMRQKDYFNAKATFESLSKNAADADVRNEARRKYEDAILLESRNGKLKN
jgi:TolA-binding protein